MRAAAQGTGGGRVSTLGTAPAALYQWLRRATQQAPKSGVYAILDGARDPRIHRRVLDCGLPYACLYAGALPPELVEVAPYLVRLLPNLPATRELVEESWGRSWGIFLQTETSQELLRRHLRRFLKVQDARGKPLVFRYYDPRVLRVYLPTCTADELAFLFGPIQHYFTESEQADALLSFARRPENAAPEAPVLSLTSIPLAGTPG
jgi:hypothetical protein